MTGADHYKEAERLAALAKEHAAVETSTAQLFATLAVAYAQLAQTAVLAEDIVSGYTGEASAKAWVEAIT